MSNRMTKLSTRNAKDTIIELVIKVRIVVTHKVPEFEDVEFYCLATYANTRVSVSVQKKSKQQRV